MYDVTTWIHLEQWPDLVQGTLVANFLMLCLLAVGQTDVTSADNLVLMLAA